MGLIKSMDLNKDKQVEKSEMMAWVKKNSISGEIPQKSSSLQCTSSNFLHLVFALQVGSTSESMNLALLSAISTLPTPSTMTAGPSLSLDLTKWGYTLPNGCMASRGGCLP